MAGTLVANTINTDTGLFSTNNAYLGIAKAWVTYNGTSQTILGSFNVSSVTYNSGGNYTFNFTTAMPNTNYAAVFGANSPSYIVISDFSAARTTTALNVTVINVLGAPANNTRTDVAIFSS